MDTDTFFFSDGAPQAAAFPFSLFDNLGTYFYFVKPFIYVSRIKNLELIRTANTAYVVLLLVHSILCLIMVNRKRLGNKKVPVAGTVPNFGDYERVFIGFPIWYGCAPNVVNSFCEAYDWTGKKVAAFATSGGSGIGKTAEKLQPYVKGASVADAKLCRSAAELTDWAARI